ncbi:hypothetical protein ACHAQA_002172 [Verticillium albo-atrum]
MNNPRQAWGPLPRGGTAPSLQLTLLFLLGALTLLLPTTAAQSSSAGCFFPNGTVASSDMSPCGGAGADTAHSQCCNQGWVCLSNGLCMAADQDPAQLADATIIRGACTDASWASPDCPRWCLDSEEIDNVGSAQPIAACAGSRDVFYCVNSDEDADCEEEENNIRFSGGTPTIMTTIGVSPTTSTSDTSATASGSGTPSSRTSSSPPDAATSAIESGSGDSGNGGGGGGGGSNALEIGLGVGIGIGVLGLLAALLFFFLWRRRVRKAKAAAELEANEAAAASSALDADGEKGTLSSAGPWSAVSGSSELPTTMSRDIQEAGADSAVFEAPVGDHTAGRAEAPEDERRFEAPVYEGTQGRHELA